MNDNSKEAPTLQVLDSGGRYNSSYTSMDDGVVRFGQVMPNSPVQAAMDNLNRLTPGQTQGQCWPPYPYDPNSRSVAGYDHYRTYPGFTGQFAEAADQFSSNHAGFSMRYQEVSAKPDPLMSNNHLLCLDDGLGFPMPETRAASLPPFSSITTQSLPPRPQSAVKDDMRGYDEGLGARLSGGNNSEFGDGITARLLERGMSLPSREENYTPPVQYRPWEANPGPVRVSSRSQSDNSQTPPSSSGAYPPDNKRDEDGSGDARSPWYRAKSTDSASYSKEPNLISLDKPNDMNSGAQQKGGTSGSAAGGNNNNHVMTPTSVENHTVDSSSGATYSTLTKVPPQFPPAHGREDPADIGRLPFPSNSFGYFPPALPPPPLTGAVGPPAWEYRNESGAMDPKYPLVPPPVRPGELQNMSPHQFLDERQMRGGNGARHHPHHHHHHHHPHGGGAGPYCQNGNDNYKSFAGHMNDAQSPGMQHNPSNAHNFSGSGGLRALKQELEPGLKGGDKHLSGASAAKSGEGRGTKHAASSGDDANEKKPKKQKRKRCGECLGCQRKDNCGECAPCRNDKSHQICKMRRCEKLIERKVSGPLSSVEPVANKLECPDQNREPWW